MVTQEGTRPLLVEIQALVDASHLPNARRLSVGLEQNRLAMLLAVLHRHAGVAAFDQDVFINAVGGVKITEPAADLAVLLAIQSSMRNKPLPRGLVVFGESGQAGLFDCRDPEGERAQAGHRRHAHRGGRTHRRSLQQAARTGLKAAPRQEGFASIIPS
jgi:predicted ATP-dependent serine protease